MNLRPVTLREANAFVTAHHRHHKPARGCISVVGVEVDGELCGVAVIGRPLARKLQDGYTAEVTRCCTDGTKNACSMLYGAARRSAKALGYRRMFTYILEEESGASLKASGWIDDGPAGGGSWDRQFRGRANEANTGPKRRWRAEL